MIRSLHKIECICLLILCFLTLSACSGDTLTQESTNSSTQAAGEIASTQAAGRNNTSQAAGEGSSAQVEGANNSTQAAGEGSSARTEGESTSTQVARGIPSTQVAGASAPTEVQLIPEASGDAFPNKDYKNYDPYRGGELCLMLRKDVAEELELVGESPKNWKEVEKILRKVKVAYPEQIPAMSGYDGAILRFLGNVSAKIYYDPLGNMFGILENPLKDTTVTDYYSSSGFAETCQYVYEWRKAGLVDRNTILSTYDLVREGYSLGFFTEGVPQAEKIAEAGCGLEMTAIVLFPQMEVINNGQGESLAYGFTFDDSSLRTEIAACNEVVELYREALLSGDLNPQTELERFQEALKEAGIEKIIKMKQKQLNSYKRHLK